HLCSADIPPDRRSPGWQTGLTSAYHYTNRRSMSRFMALALMGGALAMADATIEIKAQDWQPAGAVAFDVTNSSDEPATFSFEATDAAGARNCGTGYAAIACAAS